MITDWFHYYLKFRGLIFSGLLHIAIILLCVISLPKWKKDLPPEIEISLDMLAISNKTNVENSKLKDESKDEQQKSLPKSIEEKITPLQENKTLKKVEEKVEENASPEPKAKEEKTHLTQLEEKKKLPEPKPIENKKAEASKKKIPAKKNTNSYDSLLKTLEKTSEKNDAIEKIDKVKNKGNYDPTQKLSISVKDSIRKQIEECWNPPAGHKEAANLDILLQITFNINGEVKSVKIVDQNRYNSDEAYKVAADAAIRAVHKASPLQNLPQDQFKQWQNLEFNFDPRNLIF